VWDMVVTLLNVRVVTILMKGGIVMIPLLASSLISLTVIIERLHFWRRLRAQEVGATIISLVAEGNPAHALQMASTSSHPVSRVLQAGLEYKHRSPGTAMEAMAQAELRRGRRYLPILDTIITLAPLLGLLGTIIGMISAFGIVSEAGLGQPHATPRHHRWGRRGPHRYRHRPVHRHHDAHPVQLVSRQGGAAHRPRGGAGDTPGADPLQAGGLEMRVLGRESPKAPIEIIPMIDVMDELRSVGVVCLAIAVKPDRKAQP
jgi:biopolymer transport protein ExbB